MDNQILTPDQIAFLERIGQTPFLTERFYLTGGTPLAAFYLGHRYSEDLDFFSEQEVDIAALNAFWQDAKAGLGILKIDAQQSYNRNLFFFHLASGVLKAEFTYFPFPRIETGPVRYGIETESTIDIAVNKLFTIYQRTKARDYIDLYCICQKQGYDIADLIKKARMKFDYHIDLLQLGTQFFKATAAPDLPRMILDVPAKEWQGFFLEEARKLQKGILE
ncbi:MAG: nucleotidyl transferase AbiEii/AbiGii toxin family protein [Candidatus Uhrbacteria bacterium]